MQFLKTFGAALAAALAIVLAVFKAKAAEDAERKAKVALDESEQARVAGHTEEAEKKLKESQQFQAKAAAAKQATKDNMDKSAIRSRNETYQQTFDRWRMSNRVRRTKS